MIFLESGEIDLKTRGRTSSNWNISAPIREQAFVLREQTVTISHLIVPESKIAEFEQSMGLFQGCKKLETITLPEGLRKIPKQTFSCCDSLKNVNIPSTVKEIGDCAFFACKSLESIILPDGLIKIESGSFGHSALKEIHIPSTVKEISYDAFLGYAKHFKLRLISLPDNVKIIEPNGGTRLSLDFVMDKSSDYPAPKIITESEWKQRQENQKRAEQALKQAQEKSSRIKQYWDSHAEEKQQLENERDTLQRQLGLKNIDPNFLALDKQVLELKQKRENIDVPSQKRYEEINNIISSIRIKMENLGFFKKKEKKMWQERIEELEAQRAALPEKIEQEKKEQKIAIDAINAEIIKIEEKMKTFNDEKIQLKKRIDEINQELTKPR